MKNPTSQVCVWELPFADQLMLWAIRTWVRGYHLRTSVETVLFEAFSSVQAPQAAGLIDRIMLNIVHGRSRTIEINCLCYTGIGDDERVLLDALLGRQWQAPQHTCLELHRFLTLDATKSVNDLIDILSRVLARSNMILAKPSTLPMKDALEESFAHLKSVVEKHARLN